jgi:hypothetical protein
MFFMTTKTSRSRQHLRPSRDTLTLILPPPPLNESPALRKCQDKYYFRCHGDRKNKVENGFCGAWHSKGGGFHFNDAVQKCKFAKNVVKFNQIATHWVLPIHINQKKFFPLTFHGFDLDAWFYSHDNSGYFKHSIVQVRLIKSKRVYLFTISIKLHKCIIVFNNFIHLSLIRSFCNDTFSGEFTK